MERNLTNIKERILYYTDFKKLSKEAFFEDLGTTYGSFKGKAKLQSLSSDVLERIMTNHKDLNPIWLLTGVGEMLSPGVQSINNESNSKTIASNINGNNGNITVSHNELHEMLEVQKGCQDLQKELHDRLKTSQDQINMLLEILKNKSL